MGANKTVLVFPVNAVGHIHATLSLADKLKRDHNYRTVFMTIGPTIDVIKDHGHELIELEEVYIYEEEVDGEKRTFLGYKRWPRVIARGQEAFASDSLESFFGLFDLVGKEVVKEIVENNARIEEAIERVQPDLIILDYLSAPLCVLKNQHKWPWVNVSSPNPMAKMKAARQDGIKPPFYLGAKLFTKRDRQCMAKSMPDKWAQLLNEWKTQSEQVERVIKDNLKAVQDFYEANDVLLEHSHSQSPYLNIYLCPEAMDYVQEDDILVYPPRWIRCGPLVRQPIGQQDAQQILYWSEKLDQAMGDKKEMIYFSLGSIASSQVDLMQKYIGYLSDDVERLYVVSKGVNGDKIELNAGNMIGANYLPQPFFIERAKLVIIHGGNNGITESVYFGKPMIVLPMFGDQMDNAQRVEDVGLGCRLNLYHCTRKELRDAIERLTGDTELANKMRAIGERMRSSDDLDRISSMLKTLIETKQLDEELIRQYLGRAT